MDEHISLWKGGPVMLKSGSAMAVGTDGILLADFAGDRAASAALDMGCGSGIIGLLLAERMPRLQLDGIEINSAAAHLAERNMALNGLEGRVNIICGDLRTFKPAAKYDLVVSNPPYFSTTSGRSSPDPDRAMARSEETCSLEELVRAAAACVKFGGRFDMVYRPDRLSEAMSCLSSAKLEPKRMRLVQARSDAKPSLVLIECRSGGKPGVDIMPTLILKDEQGRDTPEVRRIYHLDG